MMSLAIAVHDSDDAIARIADITSAAATRPPREITVIGISRIPWRSRFALATGLVTLESVDDHATQVATQAARTVAKLLPTSVPTVYLVCGGLA